MDWQPIETAPRDGTGILVWTERGCFSVEWNGPSLPRFEQNESAYSDGWYVDNGSRDLYDLRGPSPTHWMPLPEPPTA